MLQQPPLPPVTPHAHAGRSEASSFERFAQGNCRKTGRKQAEMEASWASTGFLQLLRVWVRGSQWSGPKEWGGRAWHAWGPRISSQLLLALGWAGSGSDCSENRVGEGPGTPKAGRPRVRPGTDGRNWSWTSPRPSLLCLGCEGVGVPGSGLGCFPDISQGLWGTSWASGHPALASHSSVLPGEASWSCVLLDGWLEGLFPS